MFYLPMPGLDARFNLALEECLFRRLTPEQPGFFLLWQNSPSVIIGRHQVAEWEIDKSLASRMAIPVIRRISGGGAVYHDEGVLNFSFIANAGSPSSFMELLEPIRQTLNGFGLETVITGRNDLAANGKKICGCALARSGRRLLFHGCLLVNVNLGALCQILTPDSKKLAKHGVASVRSRIANLQDFCPQLSVENLKLALLQNFSAEAIQADRDLMAAAKNLATLKYGQWEWNYGVMPDYDIRRKKSFTWGQIELFVALGEDVVKNCAIRGDFFSNTEISKLEGMITGQKLASLTLPFEDDEWQKYFPGCEASAMREFFTFSIHDF